MSLCEHCVKGVIHEGEPKGKFEKIGGVESYVATPSGDYPKDKVILFLPDVFGLPLTNNLLLADSFAENGFKTVIPDYFNGDALPTDALAPGSKFDIQAWLAKHGAEQTRPPLDKVIAALKEQGVKTFGAVGYCFGARYSVDLSFENIIQANVITHPSLLKIPEDLEKYAATSKVPLLINSCEIDSQFPPEAAKKADEIFAKFEPGYKRVHFEGCTHGFAVRGDLSDPKVKAGKEGAFKETVEWFLAKL
ncbi:hypothetical protein CVT26_003770 [Gymnopilus dilepis]|uniref:Dienelactone hydrolase domain-containing protein n=1 Tax=Gymnopilus dilepis TaxID=231916 RepID=A0A409W1Q7_9AGAR|nr:hypothetical protein CVT26_003770 [Gymnopilus dilepis]